MALGRVDIWGVAAHVGQLEQLADRMLADKETPDNLVNILRLVPVRREKDIDRMHRDWNISGLLH